MAWSTAPRSALVGPVPSGSPSAHRDMERDCFAISCTTENIPITRKRYESAGKNRACFLQEETGVKPQRMASQVETGPGSRSTAKPPPPEKIMVRVEAMVDPYRRIETVHAAGALASDPMPVERLVGDSTAMLSGS